jgi:hypothetical protein
MVGGEWREIAVDAFEIHTRPAVDGDHGVAALTGDSIKQMGAVIRSEVTVARYSLGCEGYGCGNEQEKYAHGRTLSG